MGVNAKKLKNEYIDAKEFEKNFIYYEDLEKNPELLKQIIEQSHKEYEEGKYCTLEEFMAEMEAKFHFNDI